MLFQETVAPKLSQLLQEAQQLLLQQPIVLHADSEEVATQIAKNCRRRQPHSHLTPPPRGIPSNIPINLIFPETRESLAYIFVADSVRGSVFIQICAVGSKRRIVAATERVLAVQCHARSSKVNDFGTNRKRVCGFLLVINIVTIVLSCTVSEIWRLIG